MGRAKLALAATALLTAALPLPASASDPGVPLVPAPGVPGHGRAWELVTSTDIGTASFLGMNAVSTSGDRAVFRSLGLMPGATALDIAAANLTVRGPTGWATGPLDPPDARNNLNGRDNIPLAFTPDLTASIWRGEVDDPTAEGGRAPALFRHPPSGAFTLISPIGGGAFLDASSDLSRVFFQTDKHLLPADAGRGEGMSIYEASAVGLRVVDVANDGSLLSDCGSASIELMAASDDGHRAFFETHPCAGAPAQVYLRQDAATTTEISASQCSGGGCGPAQPAQLVGSASSGASAFIVSAGKLTGDDGDEGPDLYRYDVGSGKLALVSSTAGLDVAATPVVASPDGSRVLFCGSDSLGGGPSTVYLADQHGVRPLPIECEALSPSRGYPWVQWSADSRYALLVSSGALAPNDTDSQQDIYRYDGATGTFTDVSTGVGGAGNGPVGAELPVFRGSFGGISSLHGRFMSDSGGQILFSTAERLVPEDRNNTADAYEWSDGDLALVSDGTAELAVHAYGISADGRAAFFKTAATLLPGDNDGGAPDIYAAVSGGGFPEPQPPSACAAPCGTLGGPRIQLGAAASAAPLGGGIRLRQLGPAARRRAVGSGKLTVLAEVPRAGRLTAEASAKIGRRSRTLATSSQSVGQPGPVQLSLGLTKAAKRRLAAGESLRVELVVRLSGLAGAAKLNFTLGDGR